MSAKDAPAVFKSPLFKTPLRPYLLEDNSLYLLEEEASAKLAGQEDVSTTTVGELHALASVVIDGGGHVVKNIDGQVCATLACSLAPEGDRIVHVVTGRALADRIVDVANELIRGRGKELAPYVPERLHALAREAFELELFRKNQATLERVQGKLAAAQRKNIRWAAGAVFQAAGFVAGHMPGDAAAKELQELGRTLLELEDQGLAAFGDA